MTLNRIKKIIAVSAITISFAACTSVDAYTGETKTNDTTKGAAGGAVAGALAGQLLGGDTKATLIGAAAGSLLGAGIGHHMDKQESELREQLASTGVGIKKVGDNQLKLIMPGNLTFKSGSSSLTPQAYDVLNSISEVLEKYDTTSIRISGYTDNTGTEKINSELSKERADAVYYYLNGRGVKKGRMVSQGFGPSNPIADNSTESGRSQNRRVEISIIGN